MEPTEPIGWTVNDIAESFFVIFDLLGAFLSIMGPAPANTTLKNFFLPLTVVFAQWCIALARGVHTKPSVCPVTWTSKDGGKTQVCFLGCSLAGFNYKLSTYKTLVREACHTHLCDVLHEPWTMFGESCE